MVQWKIPIRAYKRLIYLAFVSSFLCFLALHLSISYQQDRGGGGGRGFDLIEAENNINLLHNHSGPMFRGLLQKTSWDYVTSLLATSAYNNTSSSSSLAVSNSSKLIGQQQIISNNSNINSAMPDRTNESSPVDMVAQQQQPSISTSMTNFDGQQSTSSLSMQHDEIARYLDAEPMVDLSPNWDENQILETLEHDTSNLAVSYWMKARKYPKPKQTNNSTTKNCRVEFPNLYELQYNNVFWQKFSTQANNSSFYLYGAYYDNRWRGGPLPMVRILAMIDRVAPPPTLCQIWFDRISVPIISPATYIYGWYSKWGNYKDGYLQPYIVTCKIPRIKGLPKNFYPTSVSLVENRCSKATNNLRIINNRPEQKQRFGVCVKGLDFLHEDLSVRLVEWIELLRLLGAQKIFLYELEIHPNISKVLQHYQKDGIVELTKITLPGNQPNLPGLRHLFLKNKLTHKRQNELIPYNDCLYRNLYSYEYLALLDIDEIIMPIKHSNWSELMDEVHRLSFLEKNYTRASYNVRNVYFLDDLNHNEEQMLHEAHENGVPRYLHMLQHVYRSQNYTKPGQYVKCFHNTERAVSLHNHFPLNCFGTCTTYSIPIELAHLQHYRKDCVGPLKKSCKEFRSYTTRDTTIFRYKEDLVSRTTKTLEALKFFDHAQQQRRQ